MADDSPIAVMPLAMRMGGGLIFVVKADGVDVLRIVPGLKDDDALEVIGTANREHVQFIAAELTAAMTKQEN